MNIIQQLLQDVEKEEACELTDTKIAFVDLEGGRLAVSVTDHKGGDGQNRKINKRVAWTYAGKRIKREELDKLGLLA
jgi:hypothetical protein